MRLLITSTPNLTIAATPAIPGARYQTACAPAAAVNYVIAHSADVQQFRIVGTCTTRAHTTIIPITTVPRFVNISDDILGTDLTTIDSVSNVFRLFHNFLKL